MNAKIKAEWLKRLRKYKKGTGCLRSGNGTSCTWCCLGVLADIYVERTPGATWHRTSKTKNRWKLRLPTGEIEESFLLEKIAHWAGLAERNLCNKCSGRIDIRIRLKSTDPLQENPDVRRLMSTPGQLVLSVVNDMTTSFELARKLIRRYL